MDKATPASQTCARIPTDAGEFSLIHHPDPLDGKEHLALLYGDIRNQPNVLTRVHSECFTGDVLGSQRCDCGEQLQSTMRLIVQNGSGLIIYLRQEGRGIGLEQKLRAYNLQDQGYDTVDANLMLGHAEDERSYTHAATILKSLGIQSVQLLTNNPTKIKALEALGIAVDARIPLVPTITSSNKSYIQTKVERMQHLLDLPNGSAPSTGGCSTYNPSPPVLNGAVHRTPDHPTKSQRFPATVEQNLAHLADQADQHFERTGLPFVTLSYAQSIDGSIAAQADQQLLLSGPESMRFTHALRAQHSTILVGIGTILSDDPRLTVRLVDGPSPQPIILDSIARCPPHARVFDAHHSVWIATASEQTDTQSHPAKNAEILFISPDPNGQVDLPGLLKMLGQKGVRSVMVEGGSQIISSFLSAGSVNQIIITIAPTFVGGLHAVGATGASFPSLDQPQYIPLGDDLIVWAKPTPV